MRFLGGFSAMAAVIPLKLAEFGIILPLFYITLVLFMDYVRTRGRVRRHPALSAFAVRASILYARSEYTSRAGRKSNFFAAGQKPRSTGVNPQT
jgi:uncharacterized membrane protein